MRTILHVDLNNFYASVERALDPSLRDKNVGVCGNVENRHGIILAKSEGAKKLGVKTGMTIRDAQKLCPDIVFVEAHHKKYAAYSELCKDIYRRYTDYIEPFGIDECWLDVTSSVKLFGSGEKIANEIRSAVKNELNLTVSVGVSFNKVFAKLGSDLKKPDAVTVISPENFKEKIYPLPAGDLLFVGKSTADKLKKINVLTIGDLALLNEDYLLKKFGKAGRTLRTYALGEDDSPVLKDEQGEEIKSVGNSMTSYRDIVTAEDAAIVFTVLSESVSYRALKYGVGRANTLSVFMRNSNLECITRQVALPYPTLIAEDLKAAAMDLFIKNKSPYASYRTLGLSVSGFEKGAEQTSIFDADYEKKSKLSDAVRGIKTKYGNEGIVKGVVLKDKKFMREEKSLSNFNHSHK